MKTSPNPGSIRALRTAPAFTLIELLTVIAIIGILAAIIIPTVGAVRGNAQKVRCLSNLRQIGMAMHAYVADNKNNIPVNVTGRAAPAANGRWADLLSSYIASITTGFRTQVFYCSLADPAAYAVGGNNQGQYAVSDRLNGNPWPNAPQTVNGVVYPYAGQTFPRGVPFSLVATPARVVVMGETPVNAATSPNLSVDNFFPTAARGAAANHRSDRDPTKGDGPGNYLYLDGHVVSLSNWPGKGEFEIK